jgi:formyltetrahydrofolate-dependent phosphoribosylglycinamide formyltransferase
MLTIYQHFEKIFYQYWRGFQPIHAMYAQCLSYFCKHLFSQKKDCFLLSFFPQFCTMFKKLQQKWKVNGTDLALILCTFAVTGTLTAWISKQITSWLEVSKYSAGWWALKIGVLLFGYQIIILIIGFCFGQFRFFWNYEKKILRRLGLLKKKAPEPVKLAIFASGGGSNALALIQHFSKHPHISVGLLVCNNPNAGVLSIATQYGIPTLMVQKDRFFAPGSYVAELRQQGIGFIALAGFLWKLPTDWVAAWPQRIVNIHPALLPQFGGKGMYGQHVHQAVLAANEAESGITIHYVDEQYDHGSTVLQARCPVLPGDTPQSLASRVQVLEHAHYGPAIENLLTATQPKA